LRHAGRADRVLGRYLRNLPYVQVMTLLRLGTVEMLEHGMSPHGVVHDLVALAKTREETASGAGLINAVLRKVAEFPPEDWAALAPGQLPAGLRKPLVAAYGGKPVRAMEAAHAAGAPVDLTLKAGDAAAWATRLGAEVLPTGSLRLAGPGQVSALPGFADGDWWVQDAAAAMAVQALGDVTDARVADLCAAPGGKTLQLAAAGARVTAVDSAAGRMARVTENLARTGFSAETVVADVLEWTPTHLFDVVLLDAPCSATGTIRRHPDLPFAKAAWEAEPLIKLQAQLFARAVTLVRPGGRLLFCTCSLLPAEGETHVAAALASDDRLSLDLEALARPGIDPAWIGETGLRLRPDYWPELGGMDGFFITVLRKAS